MGQPLAALSSISEVFSSRRFRMTPLSVLEPIMIKFLELCVDLRKGRTAKDGLILYKNVAQNTSVQSVEVTIQKLLDLSRAKLDDALHKVNELEGAPTSGDVEDLEATETPESILLSAVSEEKTRDRTYRTLVTPWLRFLWESYRTALEILRNNARLEVLYQVRVSPLRSSFRVCRWTDPEYPPPPLLPRAHHRRSATRRSSSACSTSARPSSAACARRSARTSRRRKSTRTSRTRSTSTSPTRSSATSTRASSSSTRPSSSSCGRRRSAPPRTSTPSSA